MRLGRKREERLVGKGRVQGWIKTTQEGQEERSVVRADRNIHAYQEKERWEERRGRIKEDWLQELSSAQQEGGVKAQRPCLGKDRVGEDKVCRMLSI